MGNSAQPALSRSDSSTLRGADQNGLSGLVDVANLLNERVFLFALGCETRRRDDPRGSWDGWWE